MQFKRTLLVSALSLVMTTPSFAWQVDIAPATATESAQITVSNTTTLEDKLVYLVWMDLDASDEKFLSWTTATGWQKGLLPIAPTPVKVEKFEKQAITGLSATCPASHRCFVALVATKPDANPLDSQQWDAVSILPLTTEAGYLRLPGQRFFVSPDGYQTTTAAPTTDDSKGNDAETDTGSGTTTTEKPDIFRVVGQKIFYANTQSRKFQVIDISDVMKPKLAGEIALTGTPREIYTLDDKIVLLQSLYTGEVGTHITVLQQGTSNTLNVVSETQLSGSFLESRRRNDIIYAVTQMTANLPMPLLDKSADIACVDCGSPAGLQIVALRLNSAGVLENLKQVELVGYSPTVSIFNDYLVVTNSNPDNWQTSLVQVYQLDIAGNPLQALPSLTVAGRIPSEFHVDVNQQQLRVVFGNVAAWREDATGSTLAIYSLPSLQFLGKVDKIAPKEALFATRFVGDRAYVVTYEQKDPLWVIDLSSPTNPKILGELVIPGWSEKLFFHDNLLLGIGFHDVPEVNEENQFIRRVALSLFDVTNPTQPTFINRIVPLAGQAPWSYSQAIQDERALLLNWDSELTAFPLESWSMSSGGSYLQIASLANRQLTDKGLVDIPVSISRSTEVAPNVLAALGDQSFFTIQWGNTKPTVLGELELGRNLVWLKSVDDKLLAGGYGMTGYSRLYQFSPTAIENPQQHWSLAHNYNNIAVDGHTAVFYNYNPLSVQTVNTDNNVISPAWTLDENTSVNSAGYWLDRSEPLAYQGHFYVAEKWNYAPVIMEDGTVKAETDAAGRSPIQWQLRDWDLTGEKPVEAKAVSIPGRPIGFSSAQTLITQEASASNQLVLNQVRLASDGAMLISSRELACSPYSQVLTSNDALYIKCDTVYNDIYYPMTTTMDTGADASTDKMASDGVAAPVTETEAVKTTIIKVSLNTGFADLGKWSFEGYQQLQAVNADKVLLGALRYYYYMDTIASSSMPFIGNTTLPCNVYQLTADKDPLLLKEADCSNISASALSEDNVWFAKGFEGLTKIDLQ